MERFTDGKGRMRDAGGKRHDGRRSRNNACLYGIACMIIVIAAKTGAWLVPEFPSGAFLGMLKVLIPGGVAVFLILARFLPSAENSEYFRVFGCLYHPGIWLLAESFFAETVGGWSGMISECLHMAYIAGWTLLAAGIIVLILIVKEKQI